MSAGTVKWFNEKKGYGFIVDDDLKKDIFVHYKQVEDPNGIMEGDRVEYTIGEGRRGRLANDVKRV